MGMPQHTALLSLYGLNDKVGNYMKDRSIDHLLLARFDKLTHLYLGDDSPTQLTIILQAVE